jgi:HEAT repeat protein
VDWQRFAVMSKASGEEPPWRLRLEAEYQAAHAAAAGTDELLRYSEHASPHVRSLAAQMLGVTGASRSQERLRTLLATDPAAIVRNYAVEALSRLPAAPENAGVTAAIAGALKDANGNVRFSAQQAQLRLQKRVPGGAALLAEWTRGFDPRQLDTARVGGPAPAFALTSDAGQTVRLADFRSRKTVVLLFQLADW